MTAEMITTKSNVGLVCYNSNVYANNIYVRGEFKKPVNFDLPPKINQFVGREDDLKQLENLFFERKVKVVVISGLPGIGKTELAKMFAWKCQNEKQYKIFWCDLENDTYILDALKTIDQQTDTTKRLIIFDNPPNKRILLKHMKKHLILITSTTSDWHNDIPCVNLTELQDQLALKIFESSLGTNYDERYVLYYQQLVKIANNIPLLVKVIAEYTRKSIMNSRSSFDYKMYIKHIKDTLQIDNTSDICIINRNIPDVSEDPYTKSFYQAIKRLLITLKDSNMSNKDLTYNTLYVCSFLHPDKIVLDNLSTMLIKDKIILEEALGVWQDFAFLKYNSETDIKIYKILQNTVQCYMEELDQEMQSNCYKKCLEFVVCEKDLNPHMSTILTYADKNMDIFLKFYSQLEECLSNKIPVVSFNLLDIVSFIRGNIQKRLQTIHSNKTFLQVILENLVSAGCKNTLERLFLHYGTTTTTNYINEFNLLHHSIKHEKLEIMNLLLEYKGIDLNKKDENKNTPLHEAAMCRNNEIIDVLLSRNVNKTEANAQNLTPCYLFLAAWHDKDDENNNIEILRMIDLLK